jgi:hypothetical protein
MVRRWESGVLRMVWVFRMPALLIKIDGLPSFCLIRFAVEETVAGLVMSQLKK